MDGMPAVDNWRRLATAVIPMQVVGRDGPLGDATHRANYTLTTFISGFSTLYSPSASDNFQTISLSEEGFAAIA
jgi:hypothetical protein